MLLVMKFRGNQEVNRREEGSDDPVPDWLRPWYTQQRKEKK